MAMAHTMRTSKHQQRLVQSFEHEVRDVLHRLRLSLSNVLMAVGHGLMHQRATELQQTLNIRSTLAWRIHRFVRADDPVQEAVTLPGRTAMGRFFEAARRYGVEEQRIRDAEEAMEAFEAMLKQYAETRTAFDSMITDIAGEAGSAVDLSYRKAAYSANSHIWGVQVGTRFSSMLCYRGSDRFIDMVNIHGAINLRQIRASQPFVLVRTHTERTPGSRLGQPIDEESHEQYGVSILPEFCSTPTPQIETHTDSNGELVAELIPSAMGKRGAVSAVVATLHKQFAYRYKLPKAPTLTTFGRIDAPYEVCLADILIEEGAYGSLPEDFETWIIGRHLTGIDNLRDLDRQTLWSQAVAYLGRGTSRLATPYVQRYPDLIEYVAQRVGIDAQRLHVYRCCIEYPVMPSTVGFGFSIPLTRDQLRSYSEA